MYHRYFGPLIGGPAFIAYWYEGHPIPIPCSVSWWIIPGQEWNQ
jgi:hypothetical protein